MRPSEKLHRADVQIDYFIYGQALRTFSQEVGDQRRPHKDLLPLFDGSTSKYGISLVDLIKEMDEDLLAGHDLEFYGFSQPGRLSEILEAEKLLFKQVWCNRHWNLRTRIERGDHEVVPKESYSTKPYRQDQTLDSVWKMALEAAKRVEGEVGVQNLGPWDDFEGGMLDT